MLSLETLLQAAEGGEKEMGLVHADFEEKGMDSWLRGAIERRLDPALGARVVPPRRSEEVLRVLEGFYAFWGRWFPAEYRRVRREWVVLQARWRGMAGVRPARVLDSVTSRFFREGLVELPPMAAVSGGGGFEAGLEALGASDGAASDGAAAGGGAGQPVALDGGAPESPDSGRGEPDEPAPPPPAPVVHAGSPAPARLPDSAEVLADPGGRLPPALVSERLDRAVRAGVDEVEKLRSAWLKGPGWWRRWPEFGRSQERVEVMER